MSLQLPDGDLDSFSTSQLVQYRDYWTERLRIMKNTRLACYGIAVGTLAITLIAYLLPPISSSVITSLTGFLVPLLSAYLLRIHISDAQKNISRAEGAMCKNPLTLKKDPL